MRKLIVRDTFLTLMLVCFSFFNASSNGKLPFRLERINTDYNGIIYNGNNILAYGNYGVITYSLDKGENWKQISLGDKLDILKIITIEDVFYALTPYSLLKSSDDGLNWTQKTLFDYPNLKDFAFDGKFFYLISENSILRIDSSLNGELETIFQFELSSLSEIVYLQNHLFCIENKYYIYRINLETNEVQTIDLHQIVLKNVKTVRDISHLKVFGANLYLLCENVNQNNPQYTKPGDADQNIRHYLLKSEDLGQNWNIVTRNIRLTKEYQIIKDTVYFITHKGILDTTTFKYYYTIRYFKIDADGNEEEINKDEMLDKRIPAFTGEVPDHSIPNTFQVSMFIHLGDEKIIAVGPSKTILVSKNNGEDWELISYFKSISDREQEVKFLGIDTILVLTNIRPFYFISFNRGATFLPPNRYVENFPEKSDNIIAWNDGTFGFVERKVFSHDEKINDSMYQRIYDSTHYYMYYSTDFGKSFTKKVFYRSHIIVNDSVSFDIVDSKVTGNKVLLVFGWFKAKKSDTTFDSYFYFFDKSFNVVDSIVQVKVQYYSALSLLFEDTISFRFISPFIYKSKDFGKNWDTIPTALKDENSLKLHHKDYLLIQNEVYNGPGKETYKLYIFNLKNSTFDSIVTLPLPMEFFVHNDTIFAQNFSNDKLYFFPDGIENMKNYDSIEISELLNNNPRLINFYISNDNNVYSLILKEVGSSFLNRLYELNIAKVGYGETKYLSIEPEIEKIGLDSYNSLPFPMPVRDNFTIFLYWDSFQAREVKVEIYDIYGNKYLGTKAKIELLSSNSGLLEVDCSGLANGVYTIILHQASKAFAISFIVVK